MATTSSSSSSGRVKKKATSSNAAAGAKVTGAKLPPPGQYRGNPKPSQSSSPSSARAKPTTPGGGGTPPTPRRPIRPVAIILPSLAIFAFTTYGTYLYTTYTRAVSASTNLHLPANSDVSDRYDKTYPTYDTEVETSEWLMNLPKRRRELAQRARGHVLEVSCGTGRNMEFYEIGERRGVREGDGRGIVKGCKSLTFVDRSEGMVEVAKRKFEEMYPLSQKGRERGLARFFAQDALEDVPAPPAAVAKAAKTAKAAKATTSSSTDEPFKFDTVIQTMGLCSHPDPVSLLRHFSTITEPEKGQILLLEHGRSHYKWLNRILDGLAAAHADRHGCWWNRDIGELVERSGLVVVEEKRWHLGTTWAFVLRPVGSEVGGGDKGGT